MLIWISPDTIGTVTNPTANTCTDVHEATKMTKDAVRYAKIDADLPRLEGGNS